MVKVKCAFCDKEFKKPKLPDNVIQLTKDICSNCWAKEGERLGFIQPKDIKKEIK